MRIGLKVSAEGVLDRFERALPWGWKPVARPVVDYLFRVTVAGVGEDSRRKHHLLSDNVSLVESTPDFDLLVDRLERELSLTVAELSPLRIFVHAGVVEWRGRAVVIPGPSHSGKSTLVAELVRLGARYYSDEFAVFDRRGRVHPYARPLGLRSHPLARAAATPVATLGGQAGTRPLAVGAVVATRFREGASWKPIQTQTGEALLSLLANAVGVRRHPDRALATLSTALSDQPVCWGGDRGESLAAANAILRHLSTGS